MGFEKWEDRYKPNYEDDNASMLYEMICNVLNDKELAEHGGSVGGSWLTEKVNNFIKN